jgi:hypothetical protein
MIMPRFYFHLSASGQDFRDSIGCDVNDLSAAHSRAVQLADRVMMFSAFADRAVEFRRCTVKVADDRQRPVMTVIFPADFVLGKCDRRSASGANGEGGAAWPDIIFTLGRSTTRSWTKQERYWIAPGKPISTHRCSFKNGNTTSVFGMVKIRG